MPDSTPIEIAKTFFGHWNANRVDEALAMLASDVVYDNVPLPNIVGADAVAKFHKEFGIGTAFTLNWQVKAIAADGNVVLNERVDIFRHQSGGTITLPVMGTITVVDGKITVWRDYFDAGDFDRQLSQIKL
ncbi:limonene-1,2-epoxide hydrolase family protein [Rhizobium leguminosarum]